MIIFTIRMEPVFFILINKKKVQHLKKIILDTQQNILPNLKQEPEIIICSEKSLSALFYYYKRFHKHSHSKPIIIIQSQTYLPCTPIPSKILLPQLPNHVIAAIPYFEDLGIPSRIASTQLELPGWYHGHILDVLPKKYEHIVII